MEGIFRADISPTIANEVLSEKSSRLICCFSREAALLNPLMWGYYAGGFKGLAIEVTINGEESEIHEVH
ncbi:MAG TPA: hypothetical protein VK171_14990, partial [Fimbriimonas sp.]|nr:hypothetical protein [Fimbriimonas sp.]